ncbi:MAG: SIR2 family protein, partial [Gammaproteobacteria bacterium]
MDYRRDCDRIEIDESTIDLEELMSYLDIEHFLELRGSKAWSAEGNEAQIMIKKAIGSVIHGSTPSASSLPQIYYDFAEAVSTRDVIITLNYDVLLERAFEHVGKPYRLFPDRYKSVTRTSGVIDSDVEEVTILKLHGSVDWFDDRHYLESKAYLREFDGADINLHSVFDNPERYGAERIVSGPRLPDDPLLHIFRIREVDEYYRSDAGFNAPFLLSPSHVKFVYAQPLLGFWYGMGRAGGYNLGISVVGFSLPAHDEYIRIGLYQMISNYQYSWWDEPLLDVLKDYVRLVDLKQAESDVSDFKKRYQFLEHERTKFYFDGFNSSAIDFL